MARTTLLRVLCLAALLAAVRPAGAGPLTETLRRVERQPASGGWDTAWRLPAAAPDRADFEMGGWSGVTALGFTNDDNDRNAPDVVSSVVASDLRLWGKAWLRDGTEAYLRLRHIAYDFETAGGVAAPRLPNDGLDLDLGYVDMTLDGVRVRAGRQYVRYGGGVVLGNTLDGVRATGQRGGFGYGLLLARTRPRELDLDVNVPSARRVFAGFDGSWRRRDGHTVFGYLLAERDRSDQPAGVARAAQGFHYDAEYAGLGVDGGLGPELDYRLEGIAQGGESFSIASGTRKSDIRAFAALASLVHHRDVRMHPTFSAEYAMSTGDGGRLPGVSTVSGNAPGARDRTFLGFGRYDGGIALDPRLSNLHVIRFGGSVRPWEGDLGFEQLTLGGKYSFYSKNDRDGGISDPQALLSDEDVGRGIDLYLGWRLASDVAFLLQYGQFDPGDSYAIATNDSTRTIYSNLTYSF